jgi:hypothetical protein
MCTLATSTLPFSAQICVLWPLLHYLSVYKYVYFGHFNITFECTNMCTLATITLPFSAQICVLWPLQHYLSVHKYVYFGHFEPYLSVHKYVYFGHFNITFQCTNMCTLATSTLPFSVQICVLWPLQPYLSVHKYVYFGHLNFTFQYTNMCTLATSNLTFQCTNMCTLVTSTLPFSAQICVVWPLKVKNDLCCIVATNLEPRLQTAQELYCGVIGRTCNYKTFSEVLFSKTYCSLLFWSERPNLFAICNNTFSKCWEG